MDDDLDNFLQDLIYFIKEDYNAALFKCENASEQEKAYLEGQIFAYFAILDRIENQLFAFYPEHPSIGTIAPEFGHKADQ